MKTKVFTYESAMDQALRFLSVRFLSEKELREKMMRKACPIDLIDQVEKRLFELDYLNDERLSKEALRLYMEEGKYSRRYIENKMFQRGLCISEALSDYDEEAAARRIVSRKVSKVFTWTSLYRFLGNRGFSSRTIKNIAQELSIQDANS